MLRQRIRSRSSRLGAAGQVPTVLLSLALIWYGLMAILLSVGVDPGLIDTISGYRTAFDFLAGLVPDDIDSTVRLIVAGAGVLAFLIFGYLAIKAFPTPYLARQDFDLDVSGQRGTLVIGARALERLAETASGSHPAVSTIRARATAERIELDVGLVRAERLGTDLGEIRERVRTALSDHELPLRPVDVTLAGFESHQRREVL